MSNGKFRAMLIAAALIITYLLLKHMEAKQEQYEFEMHSEIKDTTVNEK